MSYNFKNLVFEGGGVKGIAYIGALEILEARGILKSIERVGGTSAGSINAVLIGLGFTREETITEFNKLDFNFFMDDSRGILRDLNRLRTKFGWHKGDFFHNWIASLIEKKTGNRESTFLDIARMKNEERRNFKHLYFIGTNLSTSYSEVFSVEHTPNFPIADAVRISMSIPLFFEAKICKNSNICEPGLYVDGGVLRNYPIRLFDKAKYISISDNLGKEENEQCFNKETLGFRLDTKEQISVFRDHNSPNVRNSIDNIFDYGKSLISTLLNLQQNYHLDTEDWQRTIYIDTIGINTTDFDLSNEKKELLIESGKNGVLEYFKWYDNFNNTH